MKPYIVIYVTVIYITVIDLKETCAKRDANSFLHLILSFFENTHPITYSYIPESTFLRKLFNFI